MATYKANQGVPLTDFLMMSLEGLTPHGHDLSILLELQELTHAERLERHWRMAELVEELRVAGEKARATERDLPSSHR